MEKVHISLSTGLPELDSVLQGVLPGDNIVWQVNTINDYIPFVHPFCRRAIKDRRPLIYFRFAQHAPLIPGDVSAEIHELRAEKGFENFISEIFDVIEEKGPGACYVFDCLSELAFDWYSDRMLANFFLLTCPYLYEYGTAAYFALLRNANSSLVPNTIHATAQVVLDVYDNGQQRFIHPLKVYKRYSPTMYMLHAWENGRLTPVSMSATISEILASSPLPWLDFSAGKQDVWMRAFAQAQQCLDEQQRGLPCSQDQQALLGRLLRMAITRDEKLLELATRYFDLPALISISKRMIGTGLIGGKSVGMLLARGIVKKNAPQVHAVLGAHDSFYIGSDVFYTYLVHNGCWWVRRRLIKSNALLDSAEEVHQRLLAGEFPAEVMEQFVAMLDYFGQSPIIVRSSSLLEDAYGNAFSGKYESVFCANQGTPRERLENFVEAVRRVYASTMRKEALAYRSHWGLLEHDEQMAILVQRVSGAKYNELFFPQIAGVGFSFNPYVWSGEIDPQVGMLRMVFGLGTRAVDRSDDDYTRIVALNAPHRRPEAGFGEVRKYAQRRVDVLDLKANRLVSRFFEDTVKGLDSFPLDIFASRDEAQEASAAASGREAPFSWVLTFDKLLTETSFVADMRLMLKVLQDAYNHPVDIEFTANFLSDTVYRINLVQCRPFHSKGDVRGISAPGKIEKKDIVFSTRGPIIGTSIAAAIDRLVYIVPSIYSGLSNSDRYAVARIIGAVTHSDRDRGSKKNIVLLGPGRWGTTTPSLGVPVSFAEINTVSVLCEIAVMHAGLIPDVSLGTHFFNDLVEMDMLYCAIYPESNGHFVNDDFLSRMPNHLTALLPDAAMWATVVKVLDRETGAFREVLLNVNALKQSGVCYLK